MSSLNFDGIQSVLGNGKKRAAEALLGWRINQSGTPGADKKWIGSADQ
jgi:hypothetical protein